jgi:hypothetical protein
MRSYATFFVIAIMSLGLVFLLVTRSRSPHQAPAAVLEPAEPVTETEADGGVEGDAAPPLVASDAAVAEAGGPLGRPFRVTALGWEHVAAGVAMSDADAGPATPAVELAPEATLSAIEARLARSGDDPSGADVAILPLPAFVVAYERLRALEPRAFLVVGFSRGREEVRAAPRALLAPPPPGDEVKLVALGPGAGAEAHPWGSEASTVLGLFALDLLGVRPARVRLVAPASEDAKVAPFAAVLRGVADERKLALSTADAARLVPLVAIAPKAQLEAGENAYAELARAWLDGLAGAAKDASAVSRRLADKDRVPLSAGASGAPEAIVLLERMGQVEPLGIDDQAALFGSAPASLEVLAARTWQLARGGGLTTNAAPDPLPIDPRIVRALGVLPTAAPAPAAEDADAGVTLGAPPRNATPLVVYRADEASADAAEVARTVSFLAAVFPRAALRVSAKGGAKAARAIAEDAARLGAGQRISVSATEPAGAFAAVEVLSPP